MLASSKGNATVALILVALLAILVNVATLSLANRIQPLGEDKFRTVENIALSSAVETFTAIMKLSEARYMLLTRECTDAPLFFTAMASGHKCAAAGSIALFTDADLEGLSSAERFGVSFAGEWNLGPNSGVPKTGDTTVARVKLALIDEREVNFSLHLMQILPDQESAVFELRADLLGGRSYLRRFAVQTSSFPNQLYLRTADSLVLAGEPEPGDPCRSESGGVFKNSEAACAEIGNVGGGMGLAAYRGSYFALHRGLGHINRLTGGAGAAIVPESGLIDGVKVFPANSRDALINVNDLEVNGVDSGRDEVILLSDSGLNTTLSYMNAKARNRQVICRLGEMGFNQSYSGITAMPGNQPIVTKTSHFSVGTSTFLIKSMTGQMFYLSVTGSTAQPAALERSSPYLTFDPLLKRFYRCFAKVMPDADREIAIKTTGMTRFKTDSRIFTAF